MAEAMILRPLVSMRVISAEQAIDDASNKTAAKVLMRLS
jgi:hypothetical protein